MPVLRGPSSQVGGRIRGAVIVTVAACALGAPGAAPVQAAPKPIDYCLLPVAIADRWDDTAAIAGYTGGARKTPDWRNDGVLDHEAFTDVNQDGVYDPGEPFIDANGNGIFDSEPYGPLSTGYVVAPTPENRISPGGDVGLELTLQPAGSVGDESPGHYLAIQQNCISVAYFVRANGADVQSVDRLFRLIIDADPSATWDPATQQIVGSTTQCRTPRVVYLPLYDPRTPLTGSRDTVTPTKALPAFLESMPGKGVARVVLVPPTAGLPCIGAGTQVASAPSAPTSPTSTWGQLKASYR